MGPAGIGDRVEGLHAVAAAMASQRVEQLIVERRRAEAADVSGLLSQARSAGVPVEVVDDISGLAQTDAPQGVVAKARPIPWRSLDELVAATDPPAVIVLDHLEDPRNVGAIARSALAAGIESMVVAKRRAAPISATAFKAAAGALERMRLSAVSSVADTIVQLRGLGLWTIGLSTAGDRSIFGLDLLAEPVALVVGSEGAGLSRLVEERVDLLAVIGASGEVESLNASVAAALAVYELARVRGRMA